MPGLRKRDYVGGHGGALAGVRVLDLSRLVAGNTLTGVLADFGAEVIKVEPAAGDTLRGWKTRDVQANWKLYARNKKSLALDLRKPAARDLLLHHDVAMQPEVHLLTHGRRSSGRAARARPAPSRSWEVRWV